VLSSRCKAICDSGCRERPERSVPSMKDVSLAVPQQYKPVWKCIYCGWNANPKKLSGEHILAMAFGGKAVLPRASCASCGEATSQFEKFCAREIFGRLRILYGYQTRHPNKRPSTLPLDITINGKTERREVPVEEYPAIPLSILSWDEPGIFTNRPRKQEFPGLRPNFVMPPVKDQSAKLARFPPGAKLTMPLQFDAVAFSRFLAKFAHAMAVAEYGYEGFRPYLTDLIRGLDDCPSHLVGEATGAFLSSSLSGVRDIEGQIGFYDLPSPGQRYLCAQIRVFGFLGLPTYVVVPGEPL
jgi:hypothetical protein